MSVEACLPLELRGPSTTITRIAEGLSGAAVYRVEAAGGAFVLKRSSESEPLAAWRSKLHMQQLAASAGLAPRLVHVDESRRAILSAFIVDRSFLGFYANPSTHEAAVAELGRMVRRLHEIPLPPDADSKSARELLSSVWSGLAPGFPLPSFVGDAVQGVLSQQAPDSGRAPVLSHNDINPTNLVYDGEKLLMLDWETVGANEPFYDLAAIAVFLLMDEGHCLRMLSAYEGSPVSKLPARFVHDRRLVAIQCGATCLSLARQSGHKGSTGQETLDSTPSLGEFYGRLRTGAVNLGSAEGRWAFGLSLIKGSFTL